ncbi:MAG TPA: sugar ABC transporter permease [Candidatus Deferrimicrobiaceae bacterium]
MTGKDPTPREMVQGYAWLLPLVLFVGGLILVPVAGTFVTSLYREVTFLPKRFVGADNYRALLEDPGFFQSLRFTGLFTLVSVPLELGLGLLFALLMHRPSPVRGLFRAFVLVPWAIPAAVSGRVFELIYNYQVGLANLFLAGIGLSGEPVNWLGTPAGAFLSLVAADVWKTTPFVAIILLAGLSGIPEEIYRQAEVDRAGTGTRFLRITLPLLRPVLLVALLFRTIDSLRVFDLIFVLTGGGPGGATASLSLYGYGYFAGGDFGYGSAVSVVLFAIAFGLSLLYVQAARFGRELS